MLRVFSRSENSRTIVGFAVISRRMGRRWTHVRDDPSNAESAVNPAVVLRPEAFRHHHKSYFLKTTFMEFTANTLIARAAICSCNKRR
jgi:hypothetical protein